MRTKAQIKARAGEILAEADRLKADYDAGRVEQKHFDGRIRALHSEIKELESADAALKQAQLWRGGTELADGGQLVTRISPALIVR
jgi:hypothetical protein